MIRRSGSSLRTVAYGYTDKTAGGCAAEARRVGNSIDLSSRRADNVAAYIESQGIDPNIISVKGSATRMRSPPTIRRRAGQSRRIEIVLEGPGA
jgi:chemotaxis protein MotB